MGSFDQYQPLIVADIGVAHNGDRDRAIFLARTAISCGAHAVKLQCHIADAEMVPHLMPPNVRETIERCSMPEDDERAIVTTIRAAHPSALIFCTPFSLEAVERMRRIGYDAVKIGSGEVSCLPIVRYACSLSIPVILSTGMCTDTEYTAATRACADAGAETHVLYCRSEYPTPIHHAGIALKPPAWGYSDHTGNIAASLCAVARGARIIEHHIDPSPSNPDSPVAVTWPDLTTLARLAPDIARASRGAPTLDTATIRDWACHHPSDNKRPLRRDN